MAWYKFWESQDDKIARIVDEKLNPAQGDIAGIFGAGDQPSKEIIQNYTAYYEYLEVVNRGVNMIVDDVSAIPLEVWDTKKNVNPSVKGMRKVTLERLLNDEPNPYQDISSFRRNLFVDFLLDGNFFKYFDGEYMFHLPANFMTIEPDTTTYIKNYKFQGSKVFQPDSIIHVKENSFYSIYRGTSRLRPARRTMAQLTSMRKFQDNFFNNGAVPGLVIKTPNVLSEKIKERMIQAWITRYRPDGGGRRPMILDGGLEVDEISTVDFQKMAFESSIKSAEHEILTALGIPPILFDGGNNANIRPNHRLYYLETILPIMQKYISALEKYFGYRIEMDLTAIPALQPELREQAAYFSTLTNGGILTPNESRNGLGYDPIAGHDELRIPANIAGSAGNPGEGGRPDGDDE